MEGPGNGGLPAGRSPSDQAGFSHQTRRVVENTGQVADVDVGRVDLGERWRPGRARDPVDERIFEGLGGEIGLRVLGQQELDELLRGTRLIRAGEDPYPGGHDE